MSSSPTLMIALKSAIASMKREHAAADRTTPMFTRTLGRGVDSDTYCYRIDTDVIHPRTALAAVIGDAVEARCNIVPDKIGKICASANWFSAHIDHNIWSLDITVNSRDDPNSDGVDVVIKVSVEGDEGPVVELDKIADSIELHEIVNAWGVNEL